MGAIHWSNLLRNQTKIHLRVSNSEAYVTRVGANDQVRKSIRRMPWHWEPKKDVISCEKLR